MVRPCGWREVRYRRSYSDPLAYPSDRLRQLAGRKAATRLKEYAPVNYFQDEYLRVMSKSFQVALYIVTCVLVWLSPVNFVQAQVNMKIGYNLTFPDLSVNNQILSAYNPADSEVVDPFGSLGFMHGIQLGIRYRWSNMAAELGWENLSRDRTALSYRASSDSFTDRQYNYGFTGFSFGLDNYFDKFGIGSMLLYQKMGISRSIGNNDLSLVDEKNWALRFQFIIQVQQSSMVSLQLKPYYQFALSTYNLAPLASDLNVTRLSNLGESPSFFGISLVFYNGRQ